MPGPIPVQLTSWASHLKRHADRLNVRQSVPAAARRRGGAHQERVLAVRASLLRSLAQELRPAATECRSCPELGPRRRIIGAGASADTPPRFRRACATRWSTGNGAPAPALPAGSGVPALPLEPQPEWASPREVSPRSRTRRCRGMVTAEPTTAPDSCMTTTPPRQSNRPPGGGGAATGSSSGPPLL